ncbi:protein of unknown function [Pseudodesulfovibrio piezophilus C1TLV30]|uniref:Uncharacterized protein n=1 Tax=Pseudodesulfovibrio piezophilus (strain DSM 21447 / JCM 15486 / C1TLV30) TaxID=1322246 RepID=M1WTI1_PSEP2|nr:protein of unknown function [Pseudodesulfovibrio piezophilus C1TLV30]
MEENRQRAKQGCNGAKRGRNKVLTHEDNRRKIRPLLKNILVYEKGFDFPTQPSAPPLS